MARREPPGSRSCLPSMGRGRRCGFGVRRRSPMTSSELLGLSGVSVRRAWSAGNPVGPVVVRAKSAQWSAFSNRTEGSPRHPPPGIGTEPCYRGRTSTPRRLTRGTGCMQPEVRFFLGAHPGLDVLVPQGLGHLSVWRHDAVGLGRLQALVEEDLLRPSWAMQERFRLVRTRWMREAGLARAWARAYLVTHARRFSETQAVRRRGAAPGRRASGRFKERLPAVSPAVQCRSDRRRAR